MRGAGLSGPFLTGSAEEPKARGRKGVSRKALAENPQIRPERLDGHGRRLGVESSYMKFHRVFLTAFNVLARLFGSLAILAGIVFLVSAYAIKENRFLDIVIGFFLMAMGIAFLLAKSIHAEQLARMRRRMGRPGSSESGR